MDIEALAKRKVELQQTLQAISYCNVNGRTNDELVDLEMRQINARKELNDIEAQITAYTKAA